MLTPEQLSAVIAELDTKHSLLVRVCVFCAFRPSELLALRWRDFDPKDKVFHIRETIYQGVLRPFTKTTDANSTEEHLLTVAIPEPLVPEPLVKELARYRSRGQIKGEMTAVEKLKAITEKNFWRGDDNFIFCTHKGTFLSTENVQHRILTPIRKKLGLKKLNFQVLRRTMATHSQHKGSVKEIQGVLRHKSPDITATEYMQPITESMRRMVNGVYAEMTKKPKKKPSASVRPKDDEYVFAELKQYAENHYVWATKSVLGQIENWRRKYAITVPMKYVFESGASGESQIEHVSKECLTRKGSDTKYGIVPEGVAFESKHLQPLRAADILAWQMQNHLRAGDQRRSAMTAAPGQSRLSSISSVTISVQRHPSPPRTRACCAGEGFRDGSMSMSSERTAAGSPFACPSANCS